jgi:hypothetical protein
LFIDLSLREREKKKKKKNKKKKRVFTHSDFPGVDVGGDKESSSEKSKSNGSPDATGAAFVGAAAAAAGLLASPVGNLVPHSKQLRMTSQIGASETRAR